MDQADTRIREHVQRQFELLRGEGGDKLRALADLFSGLNYRVTPDLPPPIPSADWSEAAREAISDDAPLGPAIIAEGGGGTLDLDFGSDTQPGFRIIYVPLREGATRAAPLRLTDERIIAEQLMRAGRHPDSMLVFSDPKQEYWHLVNVRRVSRAEAERRDLKKRHLLRRIAVGPEDKLRTAVDQFAQIALPDDLAGAATAQQIHERHDHAFNVERVTDEFFAGFKRQFFQLEEALLDQVDDREWAHDYALRLLSRLMFIYFIQRKGWIARDTDFITHYWHAYLEATGGGDGTFFEGWLTPLFFAAFGSPQEKNRIIPHLEHMPAELRHNLQHETPFLNGGLFSKVPKLDGKHEGEFAISDDYFDGLLHGPEDPRHEPGFLEAYNFTISEDSPLDQEVAVDPEMIGRVYESLVNISEPGSDTAEDKAKQQEAGIFYTPRTEIDLMCRLALCDYLRNHLGEEHRDPIYELLFSLEAEEKREADEVIDGAGLWPDILELVRRVTVVDPACGSGSFLIGMLNILYDLRSRARDYVPDDPDRERSEADIKRTIVRGNLYGVDVMEWACHVAELRLWLQLAIHAEYTREELISPPPILPNLSFKIRQGDSLVQELGGIHLPRITRDSNVQERTRGQYEDLIRAKRDYFEGRSSLSEDQLRAQERNVFLQVCEDEDTRLTQAITRVSKRLDETQENLAGEQQHVITGRERKRLEAELDDLVAQSFRIRDAKVALRQATGSPFVWTVAFVDIFGGEDQGFDIVVGNPPYVRQEKIADPQGPDEQSAAARREYKRKLQRSVYAAYPEYFGRDPGSPRVTLGLRSDLYIYFYFHALSLLNSQGAFCFVTSNSWLDVGYGTELQEFLSRQVPIHMILDNQVRRSFSKADVNTIIALFGAPRKERDACLDHTARFVMAQVPFEEMLHPVLMIEIDEAAERRQMHEFRVFPKKQRELLEAGTVTGETEGNGPLIKIGSYGGDKWGGKYLRAPEIYWEILERAGDRLVPLGEIADVRRGFTTGCNEFFYLPSKHFDIQREGDYYRLIPKHEGLPEGMMIEAEYSAVPLIQKTKQILHPRVRGADLPQRVLLIAPLDAGSASLVKDYIQWGEAQGFNRRPTCRSRAQVRAWYSLADPGTPDLIVPIGHKRRPLVGLPLNCLSDANFNEVRLNNPRAAILVAASVFSTLGMLQYELLGRANFGQGLLKTQTYELCELLVLNYQHMEPQHIAGIERAFNLLAQRMPFMIYDDVRQDDRAQLEIALLTAVGFTSAEASGCVHELQQATCRMVWNRMAKSGNARESRQTYDEWLASGDPFDANAEEVDD